MTCPDQVTVGAFTLGTLDPPERARYAAHLDGCADCRAALQEMASLPGLLARLTPAEAAAAPLAPDEGAYRRLVAAADATRRTTRRRRLAVGVAAAVLAIGTATAVVAWPEQQAPVTTTVSATAGPVQGRATVTGTDTGSRVSLALRGVTPGKWCRLVVVDHGGNREVAGSWEVSYSGTATVTGATAIHPERLARLVVEEADGHELLTIPVSDLRSLGRV